MPIKHIIFSLFLITVSSLAGYAQEYDIVVNVRAYYWDGDSVRKSEIYDLVEDNNWSRHLQVYQAICSKQGKLLCYAAMDFDTTKNYNVLSLYNNKGVPLIAIDSFSLNTGDLVCPNSLNIVPVPGSAKYLLFYCRIDARPETGLKQLPLQYIEIDAVSGTLSLSPVKSLGLVGCNKLSYTYHENMSDIWLVTQRYDSLYAFLITSTGIASPVSSKIPNYVSPNQKGTGSRFSLMGNSFVLATSYLFPDSISRRITNYYIFSFDKFSGRFTQKGKRIRVPGYEKRSDTSYISYDIDNFSFWGHSEDTLIMSNDFWNGYAPLLVADIYDAKIYPIYLDFESVSDNPYRLTNFQFSPSGKQYAFAYNMGTGTDYYEAVILLDDKIVDNQLKARQQLFLKPSGFVGNARIGQGNSPQILYNPHPLGFEHSAACDSSLTFISQSDTSFFKTFMWVFADGDTLTGDTVRKQFAIPGTQYVKLIGTTSWGYSRWMRDSFSVSSLYFKPNARFSIKDSIGCQWIAQHYLNLSSLAFKNKPITQNWTFGDGTKQDFVDTDWVFKHNTNKTYTSSGYYTISLIVDDGYCSDTFTRLNAVKILEAPEPVLVLSDTAGCDPLTITATYPKTSLLDSVVYHWTATSSQGVLPPSNTAYANSYTYSSLASNLIRQPVIQELYGPTGCVTRDTGYVSVLKTFGANASPYFNFITVDSAQHIYMEWDSLDNVQHYDVLRNGQKIATTTDLYLTDSLATATQQNIYHVVATNYCGKKSELSNDAQHLVLSGIATSDNAFSEIKWSEFKSWQEPTSHYTLESWPKDMYLFSSKMTLANLPMFRYKDLYFSDLGQIGISAQVPSKCYKLSIENPLTNRISESNTLCVPYHYKLYIPNAFSPNNDNLNDCFHVVGSSIKEFDLNIFNMYGELLFQSDSPVWDGLYRGVLAPQGTYFYTLQVRTFSNVVKNLNGVFHLIR